MLVKLKILKTYIETNLTNNFIQSFKSLAKRIILLVQKPDGNFCLYIDYQKLNNLITKNWYLLSLIGKSLNQLDYIK